MKGFSLVELLVVMVIALIILLAGVEAFRDQISRTKVGEAATKLTADLTYWRKRSMMEAIPYGLYIVSGTVIEVFRDRNRNCRYDIGDDFVALIEMPEGVSITPLPPDNLRTILWTRRGLPLNKLCGFYANTLTLRAGSHEKRVIISRGGRIRVE